MNIVKRRGRVDLSSTDIRKPQTIEPQTRNKFNNNMYIMCIRREGRIIILLTSNSYRGEGVDQRGRDRRRYSRNYLKNVSFVQVK